MYCRSVPDGCRTWALLPSAENHGKFLPRRLRHLPCGGRGGAASALARSNRSEGPPRQPTRAARYSRPPLALSTPNCEDVLPATPKFVGIAARDTGKNFPHLPPSSMFIIFLIYSLCIFYFLWRTFLWFFEKISSILIGDVLRILSLSFCCVFLMTAIWLCVWYLYF